MNGRKPIPESWCVTDTKVIIHRFKWTINNFTFCMPQKDKNLLSLCFSADDVNECNWYLELCENKNSYEYFDIWITLKSCNNNNINEVQANVKFLIINAKGEKTNEVGPLDLPVTFSFERKRGYYKFVNKETLFAATNSLLTDNNLTILCELSMVSDIISTSGRSNVTFKIPVRRFSEDFGDLLDSERLSDVTLAVGDKKFKAHKAILSARSPVFAAMFEHDMEEKKNNQVNITDVEHETLRELLHFIYTGRAANVDKMAARLLSASDKYNLEPLKVMCEEALYKDLTVENAAESLILADLHSADQLKASIIKFIIKNHAKAVMETKGWQLVISSYQHLLLELFQSLAIQQSDTKCSDINIKEV